MEISRSSLVSFFENLPGAWLSSCEEMVVVWAGDGALRLYWVEGLQGVDIFYPGCEQTAWGMETAARRWLVRVYMEGMIEDLEILADRGEWGELVEHINGMADLEKADCEAAVDAIEELFAGKTMPVVRPIPAWQRAGVRILAAKIEAIDDWRLICYSTERGVWAEEAGQDSIESSEIWRFAPLLADLLEGDENASEEDKASVAAAFSLYHACFGAQKNALESALY